MQKASRATWAKRVEEWKQSGLEVKEFAANAGLASRTLQWWAWRLSGERDIAQSRHAEPASAAPLTFVEMTGVAHAEPIEIVLSNQVRVRVTRSFDEETLVRVLHVLEAK